MQLLLLSSETLAVSLRKKGPASERMRAANVTVRWEPVNCNHIRADADVHTADVHMD